MEDFKRQFYCGSDFLIVGEGIYEKPELLVITSKKTIVFP